MQEEENECTGQYQTKKRKKNIFSKKIKHKKVMKMTPNQHLMKLEKQKNK